MTLISVVICITLERFLNSLHTIRNFRWLEFYALNMSKSATPNSSLKNFVLTFIIIFPLPLFVLIIDSQLKFIFSPLEFLFATGILFYSIGPETFYDRLKAFCNAKQSNDEASASWFAEKILRRSLETEEKNQLPLTLINNLFPIVNDRIFAPVFWFVVLGPFGAILYRCVSRVEFIYSSHQQSPSSLYKLTQHTLGLLNWIPARLCALGFMLVGNFSESLKHCKKLDTPAFFSLSNSHSNKLLACIASGAINLPIDIALIRHNNLSDALSLIRRNIELCLGIIALLTLMGTL